MLTNESEAKVCYNFDYKFNLLDYNYFSLSKQNSSFSSKNERINNLEAERLTMYKCIIASITESETVYVDCLNTLIQVLFMSYHLLKNSLFISFQKCIFH